MALIMEMEVVWLVLLDVLLVKVTVINVLHVCPTSSSSITTVSLNVLLLLSRESVLTCVQMDSTSQTMNANNVMQVVRLVLDQLLLAQAVQVASSVIKENVFNNVQLELFLEAVHVFHAINPVMDVLVPSSIA